MLASVAVMARQLVIAVVVAVAGSQLGACTSTDDDDDAYWCSGGGGPTMPLSYVSFSVADLTCTRYDGQLACTGNCCRHTNITTMPVACNGPCVTLDEISCASDAWCFVARDFTAFYTGAPDRFLGCFPKTPFSSRAGCEERDVTTCAFDGRCAGLYHASSPAKFVECIDEAVIAGSCTEVATCMTRPPSCPADRTPGVAAGCYTGACIPNDLCAP
jgi:hypothetical protein